MPYFGIPGLEFEKKNYYLWNEHPQIYLFVKFYEITKTHNFGTKNDLFGYSWAAICVIWNQHPQIYLIAKFCEKTKMPKFGT